MTGRRKLRALQRRVERHRARLGPMRARTGLIGGALAAGLFFPTLTGSRSANPLVQLLTLARRLGARMARFFVFRSLYGALAEGADGGGRR